MENRPIIKTLENIEKTQGLILFYVRLLAENVPGDFKDLPEVWYDDQEVMLKLKWSKSTLKRRRAEGLLPYKKIRNKYYYREKDVISLLFPDNYNSSRSGHSAR